MPQLPTTQVVTPPTDLYAMSRCSIAAKSSWVWTSMKPGATAMPEASTSRTAVAAIDPTSAIRSPSTPTSQVDAGAEALQMFDSWGGLFSVRDWKVLVRPHIVRLLESTKAV